MEVELVVVLAAFGVWMYGLTDVIQARDASRQPLRGGAWVPVVFFGFAPGAIAWLVVGRRLVTAPLGEHDDLVDALDPADLVPETSEEFRQRVRARAEEQRRRYVEQQRSLEEDSAP
jgi:hypothetical protein